MYSVKTWTVMEGGVFLARFSVPSNARQDQVKVGSISPNLCRLLFSSYNPEINHPEDLRKSKNPIKVINSSSLKEKSRDRSVLLG